MRYAVALLMAVAFPVTLRAQDVKSQGSPKKDTLPVIKLVVPVDTFHDTIPGKVATTPAPAPALKTARKSGPTAPTNSKAAETAKANSRCTKNAKGVMSCPPEVAKSLTNTRVSKDSIVEHRNTAVTDTVSSRLAPGPARLAPEPYVRRTWWQDNRGWVIPTALVVAGGIVCLNRKDKCGTQSHNEATATAIAVQRAPVIGFSHSF